MLFDRFLYDKKELDYKNIFIILGTTESTNVVTTVCINEPKW